VDPLLFDFNAERAQARHAAEVIWNRPVDQFFTDHGVGHAERVARYCNALATLWDLTQSELWALELAALIHDVGMQVLSWGNWAADSGHRGETIANRLGIALKDDWRWVRAEHGTLGSQLVRAELSDGLRSWSKPPSFVRNAEGHAGVFLGHVARIAFAHTGKAWQTERERQPDRDWSFLAPDGSRVRGDLLIPLFRLADEFDVTRLRIPVFENVFDRFVQDESVAHWLACWFVDSLLVRSDTPHTGRVELLWQAPSGASPEDVGLIRDFLTIFTVSKIRDAVRDVDDYLERHCLGHLRRRVEVSAVDQPGEPIEVSAWPTLRPYVAASVKRKLLARQEKVKVAARFRPKLGGNLFESVLDWWVSPSANRRGHWRLERGIHTDTIVNCRGLVARPNVVQQLAEIIADTTGPTDCCVAVGTSMIPIALAVAKIKGARFTFTFSNPLLQFAGRQTHRFTVLETQPHLPPGTRRALVVEDIIGTGVGAEKVIETLRRLARPSRLQVEHLSLFRLGRKRLRTARSVSYRWLMEVPSVRYWADEKACEVCRRGGRAQAESEILW
jgi:orotate phosphoribosyltransferase-like protein